MYQLIDTIPFDNITSRDLRFFSIATKEAEIPINDSYCYRIGACIVTRNNLVFSGYNQPRNIAGKFFYKSIHAEMSALLKTIKKFNGKTGSFKDRQYNIKTLYVVRLSLNKENKPDYRVHNFGNCKPCAQCEKFALINKIKTIKYTDRFQDGTQVIKVLKLF